jgi:16S rRNA processing protein RimM
MPKITRIPSLLDEPTGEDKTSTGEHWVPVGVVRGAFGVHGALKVEPYADVEQSVLNQARRWRLQRPGGAPAAGTPPAVTSAGDPASMARSFPLPADVVAESSKQHAGFVIATIAPALSREQAMALKGSEVLVIRSDFPPVDADEYYWTDLIGCRVSDLAGAPLGTVVALDDHGAQSVLRLDNGILIPFVSAVVRDVVTTEKRIVADWSADWV